MPSAHGCSTAFCDQCGLRLVALAQLDIFAFHGYKVVWSYSDDVVPHEDFSVSETLSQVRAQPRPAMVPRVRHMNLSSSLKTLVKHVLYETPMSRLIGHRYTYNFSPAELCFLCECINLTSGVAGSIVEVDVFSVTQPCS